tara:strand:- start:1186 stop:1692 length:507 start_codon:yes stop_codon:yes gene_type:complete
MGTSSCATIAIQGFKPADKAMNEAYLADPAGYAVPTVGTVQSFYDMVLYPTQQDLGRTGDYPFELLMGEIMASKMMSKFKIITLNSRQNMEYWPVQLAKHGFILIDKTKNSIGSMNYIYSQSPNRPEDMTGVVSVLSIPNSECDGVESDFEDEEDYDDCFDYDGEELL